MSVPPDGPRDLADLQQVAQRAQPRWLVSLVRPEIGGGRLDREHLAALDAADGAAALRVSGLDQATFEALVTGHGRRFSALHLWKCPRIDDLSPLADLPQLEFVACYWNQRATRLWDLSRTPRLRGLAFEDFTRITALDDLRGAVSLQELEFGDVVDRRSVVETLEPVGDLAGLRRLEFRPRAVADGSIVPLGRLVGLEQLDCPTSLFSSRQFAWLRARLPDSLQSRVLQPVLHLTRPLGGKDVLLVGRRQPMLDSASHAGRVARHAERFERDVAAFRADPALGPD